MRILHTADWHLGRLFHGQRLTEDQAYVLKQFVALVGEEHPDLVVIAGDIYDRAVPPPEAVHLLDDVLSEIVRGHHTPVLLIAGNHDSPERLHFGSRLLAEQGLHVAGTFAAHPMHLPLPDAAGPVHCYALPYAEPASVRGTLADDAVHDHEGAMRAALARIRAQHPAGERAVLVTHAFVAGALTAEDSERPLSIGGTGAVDADCFAGFDYVALGHLHRRQTLGGERLHYPGSLLKYSFAEAGQTKTVSLLELAASGHVTLRAIPLTPRREVRCLEGYLAELLEGTPGNREDYLQVTLRDSGAILDAIGKLRDVYPNVLDLQRAALREGGELSGTHGDHRKRETADLFADFFVQATGEALAEAQRAAFAATVDRQREREREAAVCVPSC